MVIATLATFAMRAELYRLDRRQRRDRRDPDLALGRSRDDRHAADGCVFSGMGEAARPRRSKRRRAAQEMHAAEHERATALATLALAVISALIGAVSMTSSIITWSQARRPHGQALHVRRPTVLQLRRVHRGRAMRTCPGLLEARRQPRRGVLPAGTGVQRTDDAADRRVPTCAIVISCTTRSPVCRRAFRRPR